MGVTIGNINLSECYVGNTGIASIYVGDTKVFPTGQSYKMTITVPEWNNDDNPHLFEGIIRDSVSIVTSLHNDEWNEKEIGIVTQDGSVATFSPLYFEYYINSLDEDRDYNTSFWMVGKVGDDTYIVRGNENTEGNKVIIDKENYIEGSRSVNVGFNTIDLGFIPSKRSTIIATFGKGGQYNPSMSGLDKPIMGIYYGWMDKSCQMACTHLGNRVDYYYGGNYKQSAGEINKTSNLNQITLTNAFSQIKVEPSGNMGVSGTAYVPNARRDTFTLNSAAGTTDFAKYPSNFTWYSVMVTDDTDEWEDGVIDRKVYSNHIFIPNETGDGFIDVYPREKFRKCTAVFEGNSSYKLDEIIQKDKTFGCTFKGSSGYPAIMLNNTDIFWFGLECKSSGFKMYSGMEEQMVNVTSLVTPDKPEDWWFSVYLTPKDNETEFRLYTSEKETPIGTHIEKILHLRYSETGEEITTIPDTYHPYEYTTVGGDLGMNNFVGAIESVYINGKGFYPVIRADETGDIYFYNDKDDKLYLCRGLQPKLGEIDPYKSVIQ